MCRQQQVVNVVKQQPFSSDLAVRVCTVVCSTNDDFQAKKEQAGLG